MSREATRRLVALASRRYRAGGPIRYLIARGKLAGDPVFAALLAGGEIPGRPRILDLGCGVGLLAAWLAAARELAGEGRWPRAWPPPPELAGYRGLELMPRDVRCARRALAGDARLRIEAADVRAAEFGRADLVVALDLMHYLPSADHVPLLARIRTALAPDGRLLLRVGDAGAGARYRFSAWVDRLVCRARGLRLRALHGRPLAEWVALLERAGFRVRALPMSAGTPFANVLLVAEPKISPDALLESNPSPPGDVP